PSISVSSRLPTPPLPAGHRRDVVLDGAVALALGNLRIAAGEELDLLLGHGRRLAFRPSTPGKTTEQRGRAASLLPKPRARRRLRYRNARYGLRAGGCRRW